MATFYLRNEAVKQNLIKHINSLQLSEEYPQVITIKDAPRSLPQNQIFHAICGDFAAQRIEWAGKPRKLTEWKPILVSGHSIATGKTGEVIEGIEGELIAIRESTAAMSKKRMSSLIEYTTAFAAMNHIKLRASFNIDYFGNKI